jgi:hypothetical protein
VRRWLWQQRLTYSYKHRHGAVIGFSSRAVPSQGACSNAKCIYLQGWANFMQTRKTIQPAAEAKLPRPAQIWALPALHLGVQQLGCQNASVHYVA